MSDEARKLANSATSYAARAIASADAVVAAKTGPEAEAAASEAVRYMTLAIQALRAGAAAGLSGPEGDAAATVVEQAITATEAAQKMAAEKAGKAPGAEAPPFLMTPPPNPGRISGRPCQPRNGRQQGAWGLPLMHRIRQIIQDSSRLQVSDDGKTGPSFKPENVCLPEGCRHEKRK
ncbi:hypothetical protein ACFSHQ_12260 [Gemmobacter lanyuensis]